MSSSLGPGVRVADFELVCPVGRGGMGTVWLARLQRKLGFEKLFAIKTILGDVSTDPHFRDMFLDEARVASRINHPNVVQIFDLGQVDDLLYLVMEWVEGDPLARIHRVLGQQSRTFPLGIALRIVADACAGLHAAHELCDRDGVSLDVVHRDVSPQNILVSTDGSVKIIDFGIAKARDRFAGDTRTGGVKGKIRYMSPEQGRCETVDRRADVFAAGAVLFWLITGHSPYYGDNDLDILHSISRRKPMRELPSDVPAEVRDVVLGALTPDPADRTPSARALQERIERAMMQTGHVVGASDVAAFARDVMANELRERRQIVDNAIARLDGRTPRWSVPDVPPLSQATPVDGGAPSSRATTERPVASLVEEPSIVSLPSRDVVLTGTGNGTLSTSTASLDPPPPTRPQRRTVVLAAASMAFAVIVGVALAARQAATSIGPAAATAPLPVDVVTPSVAIPQPAVATAVKVPEGVPSATSPAAAPAREIELDEEPPPRERPAATRRQKPGAPSSSGTPKGKALPSGLDAVLDGPR